MSQEGDITSFSLVEKKGDLFESVDSLAHCVSEDLVMGRGIAATFRRKFGAVEKLRRQNRKVGDVAYLHVHETATTPSRFIFYLITKKKYFHKPTMDDFALSVIRLQQACEMLGIKKLSIPLLGCGLDGLRWKDVSELIRFVFSETPIEITVYHYD